MCTKSKVQISHVDCAADTNVPRMPPRDAGNAVRFGKRYQIRIRRVGAQSSKQGKTRKIVTEIRYNHWCGCGLKEGLRCKSQIRKHEHRFRLISRTDAEEAAAVEHIAREITWEKARNIGPKTMKVVKRDSGSKEEIEVQSQAEGIKVYRDPKYIFKNKR